MASTLTWETQADWDAAYSRSGVVTRSIGDRLGESIQLGWDPHYSPAESAVSYWTFDETTGTFTDVIGGHDGSNVGGATGSPGLLGSSAVDLDGSDDYVEVPDHTDFEDRYQMTISLWAKFDELTKYLDLVGKGDLEHSGGSWLVTIDSGELTLHIDSYDTHDNTPVENLETDRWYHIVVAWSRSDGARFYIDGEFIGSGSSTDRRIPRTSDPVTFGADIHYNSYINGVIDEPMFFDYRLSSSQIEALYDTAHSGSLVTNGQAADGAADEISVTATVPSGTSATATVCQDTTGNGEADNAEAVTIDDGAQTYPLSGFESSTGAAYWVEFELSTTNVETTPTISGTSVSVGDLQKLFSAMHSVDGQTYAIPVYNVDDVSRDCARFRDDATGEVGAARIVDHETARVLINHPVDGRIGLETTDSP